MKVIELLNKIANGEIHYSRKFRFSHKDYCTATQFFERYIVDKENLNLEIKELEDTPKEDKKIEKLKLINDYVSIDFTKDKISYCAGFEDVVNKINEIIDKINGDSNE